MATNNPAQGGAFDEAAAKRALEAARAQIEAIQNLNSAAERYKIIWDGISTSIFKISGAEWFKTVPKTNADLAKEKQIIDQIRIKLKEVRNEIVGSIPNMAKLQAESSRVLQGLNNPRIDAELSSILNGKGKGLSMSAMEMEQFIKRMKEANISMNELIQDQEMFNRLKMDEFISFDEFQDKRSAFVESEKKYNEVIKNFNKEELGKRLTGVLNGINEIKDDYHKKLILEAFQQNRINEYLEEHGDLGLNNLRIAGLLSNEAADAVLQHRALNEELDETTREFQRMDKEVFSISQGLAAATKNLTKGIIDNLGRFDQLISDAQKNTGILYKRSISTTAQMTMLTHETAQFGMTMEDTVELMGMMGSQLRTTNFDTLSAAAVDFKAIQQATGMASEDLGVMAGEMMRAGKSSKDVYKSIDYARRQAQILGVSSKKTLADIAKNMGKMREMGFKGGEESLTRMALKAEKLGQNIDSIFNMADKARSIEGAMEMAAELQLAGGSFANLNPMDLLSAARKGPEELQKLLNQMGKDLGTFNEKTGKMEFDPIDADRLKMIADATGMTITDLQNQLQKQALDNRKLKLIPDDFFSGIDGVDKEIAKMGFADMLQVGKNGKIEIAPNSELADFAKEQGIVDYTKMTKAQIQAFFEYQKKNQATMEEQAKQNQSLKNAWDSLVNAFMNLFTIFEPAIQLLTTVIQSISEVFQGMNDGFKITVALLLGGLALFGTSFISGIMGVGKDLFGGIRGAISGGGFGSFGGGGARGVAAGAVPDTSRLDPKGGGALTGLSAGIKSFGQLSPADLAKFAASMAIIGAAIIGFGAALAAVGGDASLGQFVTAGASLVMLGGSLFLLSKLKVDTKGVLQLSIAMAIIGAALIPFAYAAQMMESVSWESLAKIAVSIVGFVTLMTVAGALLMGPQLLALAVGVGSLVAVGASLAIFGASMMIASLGFQALSNVDWSGFSNMGSALLAVIPGMLGFSAAALAFVNPVSLFGLATITTVLAGLGMVVGGISEGFNDGAEGIDRFAAGLNKLQTATDKLDLAKLESLKELSEGFAAASATDAIAGAISDVMSKITGGNDKKEKPVKKELIITLKQPNGREIQKVIINDTDLLS